MHGRLLTMNGRKSLVSELWNHRVINCRRNLSWHPLYNQQLVLWLQHRIRCTHRQGLNSCPTASAVDDSAPRKDSNQPSTRGTRIGHAIGLLSSEEGLNVRRDQRVSSRVPTRTWRLARPQCDRREAKSCSASERELCASARNERLEA